MRVLWLVRHNLSSRPGGDGTQIMQTAAALRALGVQVELSTDRRPDLDGYDLVHLWHLDRLWENEPHCRRIRARGIPSVLSTIYWPADEFDRGGRAGLQGALARGVGSDWYRNLRVAQRWAMALPTRGGWRRPVWNFRRSARYCLETVSVLLPNSIAEQEVIEQTLCVARPSVIVPNAVSESFLPVRNDWPGNRQGVLCAGRIEPRKNQLALIRASAGADFALTLVGQAGRFSRGYARRCHAEAGSNVRFIPHANADELRDWYRRSRVHVCPSWYETPGLVNLEAAVCGCAVVATPGGCTREYLEDQAYYGRPDDPVSIRAAIIDALSQGPRGGLGARIARDFTWSAAAARTRDGYLLALQRA